MNMKKEAVIVLGLVIGLVWSCKQRPGLLGDDNGPLSSKEDDAPEETTPLISVKSEQFKEMESAEHHLEDLENHDLDRLEDDEVDALLEEVSEQGESISREDAEGVLMAYQNGEEEGEFQLASDAPDIAGAIAAAGLEGQEEYSMPEFRKIVKAFFKLWADHIFNKYDDDQDGFWSAGELKNWLKFRMTKKPVQHVKSDLLDRRIELTAEKIMERFSQSEGTLTSEDLRKVRSYFVFLKIRKGKRFNKGPFKSVRHHMRKKQAERFFMALISDKVLSDHYIAKIASVWGGEDGALSKTEMTDFLKEKHVKLPKKIRFVKAGSGPGMLFFAGNQEEGEEGLEEVSGDSFKEVLVDEVWAALELQDSENLSGEGLRNFLLKLREVRHEKKMALIFEKVSKDGLTLEKIQAHLATKGKKQSPLKESPSEWLSDIITDRELPGPEEWTLDNWKSFREGLNEKKMTHLMSRYDLEDPKGQLGASEVKNFLLDFWHKKWPGHIPVGKPGMVRSKPEAGADNEPVFEIVLEEHLPKVMEKFSTGENGALSESDLGALMKKIKSLRHPGSRGQRGDVAFN